jgi:aspartate/methionine/tyrosine aminotransferase
MRKVKENMPAPYNSTELFSFHSISKGITGECGLRGGYVEISEIDPLVMA